MSLTTSTASLTHMPDLGQQEIVARPDASPAGPAAIDPSMYRPLSPGQKITYGLKATDKELHLDLAVQEIQRQRYQGQIAVAGLADQHVDLRSVQQQFPVP
ncbi:Uncharacterised protein [Mycobacteroides abscessus subsp. abscessus]|nr:Uncharacterised protein [Mycobacteroides abscessus subsp. abscessus]